MPELPEIEVTRRDMEREVSGKKFKAVEAADKKLIAPHKTKAEFAKRIEGHKVKSFERRGTYIVGKLDSGELWVIDLGTSGRMQRVKGGKPAAGASARCTITFTTGGAIRLNDPKGTSRTWVITKDEFEELPEIAEAGIDPLETPVPWQTFGQVLLANPKSKLKALLQNPKIVTGLGPVYSDEVLFNAGCSTTAPPTRSARTRSGASTAAWSRRSPARSSTAGSATTRTTWTSTVSPASTPSTCRCTCGRVSRAGVAVHRSSV